MAAWQTGRVLENQHWNDTHFSLVVELSPTPAFIAGQFTRLALPDGDNHIARPYSHVSPPGAEHCEFYASLINQGELTPRLHRLQPGDEILVNAKSTGYLILDEIPPARDLWLLATGTGLGPFLSILRTEEPWQRFENIILVHGVRYAKDRVYRELLSQLAQQYPGKFQWIDFVSRERVAGALHGRIPAGIENHQLEAAAALPISAGHSQLMLCGNPQMILDVIDVLKPRGMQKNLRREPGHITVEKYW